RGIHAEEVALVADAIEDRVVDRAAALVAPERVLRLSDGQPPGVVGRDLLAERERGRSAQLDLAHVGNVEEPDLRPHRRVLGEDAAVLDGHLPAAELDESRSGGAMVLVERRTAHGQSSACPAACAVFAISIAMVIGPTPPGTGV